MRCTMITNVMIRNVISTSYEKLVLQRHEYTAGLFAAFDIRRSHGKIAKRNVGIIKNSGLVR